ncbi:MAG TPA: hypothetical protein VK648_06620 [Gemmatimonadaceae bacterium]|nr:hypothetical protein [Gemmatimonadaceae bacterium]
MSGSAKAENTVNIIIEAGEFTFNDSTGSGGCEDRSRSRPVDREFRTRALRYATPPRAEGWRGAHGERRQVAGVAEGRGPFASAFPMIVIPSHAFLPAQCLLVLL